MDEDEKILAEAKEKALSEGKEAFDYAVFAANYVHSTGSGERLTGDEPKVVQDQYERMYYVEYPRFKTVIEFADYLNELDESY